MSNRFDDWEGDILAHHGIRGMHWGVRRYQNEDGTLTAAGKAHYGMGEGEGGKKTSARKMQRDFNRLDQGRANVIAEKRAIIEKSDRAFAKAMRYAQNKGHISSQDPADFDTAVNNINTMERKRKVDKKLDKLMTKYDELDKANMKAYRQSKSIEQLQSKILAKAAQNGYTIKSKPVVRLGTTGKQRTMAALSMAAIGGGALGGLVAGGILSANATKVNGQKVKIRKNGSGTQSVANHNANASEHERRRRPQNRA